MEYKERKQIELRENYKPLSPIRKTKAEAEMLSRIGIIEVGKIEVSSTELVRRSCQFRIRN